MVYRKVASSSPIYYSIFEQFCDVTNSDVQLTEDYVPYSSLLYRRATNQFDLFWGAINLEVLLKETCFCLRLYGIHNFEIGQNWENFVAIRRKEVK